MTTAYKSKSPANYRQANLLKELTVEESSDQQERFCQTKTSRLNNHDLNPQRGKFKSKRRLNANNQNGETRLLTLLNS